jgi:hypothetical protein
MRLTFPKFESATAKSSNPFFSVLEIVWHTVIPVVLVYLMMRYNQPLLAVPVLFVLFVRLRPDELR